MKKSAKEAIKDLGLPTTGIYYGWRIGDTMYGKKIVAWVKPGRALLENGKIHYIHNKPKKK